MRVFLLLLLLLPQTLSHPANSQPRYNCTPSTITVRKEIRQMAKEGDLHLFINALKQIAKDGTMGILGKYVLTHGPTPGYWDYAHFQPRFLLWHRVFTKQLELELKRYGCPYLPYWDWSLDAEKPYLSPILSPEFFGTPDAQTGKIQDSSLMGDYLTPVGNTTLIRDYNPDGFKQVFYGPDMLKKLFDFSSDSFSKFAFYFENGPHAIVHQVLGGSTGDLATWTSPNDPIFWLHHSFCDKLFATYEAAYPSNEYEGSTFEIDTSGSEVLLPWNVPVSAIYQLSQTCTTYIDPPTYIVNNVSGNITTPVVNASWFKGHSKVDAALINQHMAKLADEINQEGSKGGFVPLYSNNASKKGKFDGWLGVTLLAMFFVV